MGFMASMLGGIGGMFKGGGNNALLGPQPMSHGGSQQLPPSPFAPQSVAPVAPPLPRVRPVTTEDQAPMVKRPSRAKAPLEPTERPSQPEKLPPINPYGRTPGPAAGEGSSPVD